MFIESKGTTITNLYPSLTFVLDMFQIFLEFEEFRCGKEIGMPKEGMATQAKFDSITSNQNAVITASPSMQSTLGSEAENVTANTPKEATTLVTQGISNQTTVTSLQSSSTTLGSTATTPLGDCAFDPNKVLNKGIQLLSNILFFLEGFWGQPLGAEFPVSPSNHLGFTPRLLYSSTHHSSESFIPLKTG